jgi:5-methylcytosine-specific restriction endonuclease McrA
MPRSSSWRSTRSIGVIVRCAILHRDGFACGYCGLVLDVRGAELDHVVARKDGGPSTPANLVTSCGPCNRGRQHGRVVVPPRVLEALAKPLNRVRGRELAALHYPSRVRLRLTRDTQTDMQANGG